jgi:hypothetical protein
MLHFMLVRFDNCLDSTSPQLVFTACATTPLILLDPRRPHNGVAPGTTHVVALFRPPFSDGSGRSLADFTTAAKFLYQLTRRTLLPRMGYREAATHIQLWLLGALVSHSEFDVVNFLICEIEDTVLDGLRARRQLPYAHYLCHIFAQLIRPPQFQGTLEASCLLFGSYRPAPEDPVPAPASVIDTQPLFTSSRLRAQQSLTMMMIIMMMMMTLGFRLRLCLLCLHALMIMRLGVPVLPLLPLLPLTLLLLRSSRPLLSSRLTWQWSSSRCPRESYRCFRLFSTDRILCSNSFWQTGLRTGPS